MIGLILISLFYFLCCNGHRTYMINGHGGYIGDTADATIEWTYDSEVWFYSDKGAEIKIPIGNQITREFEQDPTKITKKVFQKIKKGQQIPDYFFSFGAEFRSHSGIYGQITPKYKPSASSGAFGTLIHQPEFSQIRFCPPSTLERPVKLTEFAAAINDPTQLTTILWNACTVYMGVPPPPPQFTFTPYSELVVIRDPIQWRKLMFANCLRQMQETKDRISTIFNNAKQNVDDWPMTDVPSIKQDAAQQFKVATKADLYKHYEPTVHTAPDFYDCDTVLYTENKKLSEIGPFVDGERQVFDVRFGKYSGSHGPFSIIGGVRGYARAENDDNYYHYHGQQYNYNALNKIRRYRNRKNRKYYNIYNTLKIKRNRKNGNEHYKYN